MDLSHRYILALALSAASASSWAQLPVPDGVDFEQISVTEDYRSFVDNDLPSSNYYQPFKALIDLLAIDSAAAWGIGNPQGYDHGYELLGFIEPGFAGGTRAIYYWDCSDDGCDSSRGLR